MGIVAYTGKPAALNPPAKVNLHGVNSKSAPPRHLPAPLKKPYIYKKTLMTLMTLMTTPETRVVIGFACHHIQFFT